VAFDANVWLPREKRNAVRRGLVAIAADKSLPKDEHLRELRWPPVFSLENARVPDARVISAGGSFAHHARRCRCAGLRAT